MKQTKKEILKKYDLFGDPERIWADDAEKAMQEYADLYHKERLRGELIKFAEWYDGDIIPKELIVEKYLKTKK